MSGNKPAIKIRKAEERDFLAIHEFVSGTEVLESYAQHFFKIMTSHFGDTFLVAEMEDRMVGIAWGFLSQKKERTFFLWQIGVDPDQRGKGIGQKLIQELEWELRSKKVEKIELTIAPGNLSSQKLFEKMGYVNKSGDFANNIKIKGDKAVKDYYRPDGHYMFYSKHLR